MTSQFLEFGFHAGLIVGLGDAHAAAARNPEPGEIDLTDRVGIRDHEIRKSITIGQLIANGKPKPSIHE